MASLYRICRVSLYLASIVAVSASLSSCQLGKNQMKYDRAAEMNRQDFRDALAPVPVPNEKIEATPDFQPIMSTPEELRLPSPLVTVSVNQTVSLRDLMFELADQADVDLEMDPQIRGSIIFTAKDRPFDQVVNRISEMAGLRYTFEDNVLRIELDRPYVKTYNVDYLGATRKGSSKIDTSVQMTSGSGGSSSGGGSSGSSSSVETSIDGDIWKELQENLEQILTSSDTYISLATLADPVAVPVNPLPPALPVDPNNPQTTPPPLPGSPQAAPMAPGVAPTLNVSTPAAEPLVPNPPATYSISRQSGVVSVFANQRQHRMVQKFMDEFRKRSATQVLIEAKVLQVDLTDEYSAGVNWSEFDLTGLVRLDPSFVAAPLSPEPLGGFSGVFEKGDVNFLVQALARFGTVRALSSPRVTVLNGQPAIVNVAQNNVYFEYDVQTEDNDDTNQKTITVDSEQRGVPEGVLLNVVPTANPDTGEILLVVRPTISKITRFIPDPTIALSLAGNGINAADFDIPPNLIPEVSVQEMDSALRLQSGQIMVMGGLMRDTNTVSEEGVPIAAELPFIGHLFKNHGDKVVKSELVIFIKAQIVNGSNVDDMDRKIYKNFSLDRRPAKL